MWKKNRPHHVITIKCGPFWCFLSPGSLTKNILNLNRIAKWKLVIQFLRKHRWKWADLFEYELHANLSIYACSFVEFRLTYCEIESQVQTRAPIDSSQWTNLHMCIERMMFVHQEWMRFTWTHLKKNNKLFEIFNYQVSSSYRIFVAYAHWHIVHFRTYTSVQQ